jgi:hypothetical protein
MPIFHSNKPNDVLFLMPIRLADEKPPRGKVRMLYCDTAGKVYAPIINRSTYELARAGAEQMERSHKSFATLGLELSPGNYIPATVEIGPTEVWALEHILEHAINKGKLPDILKRYVKPIIRRGEANREAILSEHVKPKPRTNSRATPRVLERLPYYPEKDIELSMPVYKAEHSYPLIVLKRLTSDGKNPRRPQKLLVLDSDGDLAVIKVPPEIINSMDRKFAKQKTGEDRNVCPILIKNPKGMAVDFLPLTQPQKKALDTITRYYEETGSEKQPISAVARKVLLRAKGKAYFQAQ